MKARKYKVNWPIRAALMLICLVMMTSSMLLGLYARFTAKGEGEDSARVAKFVLMGSGEDSGSAQIPLDSVHPGKAVTYAFTVANTDGTAVCEVAQSYTIDIRDFDNLPLTYTLNGAVYNSEDTYILQAGTADTDEYRLVIEWPAENNSAALADEIDLVSITVISEQVD